MRDVVRLVLLAMVLLGCDGSSPPCEEDVDCAAGRICVDGTCRALEVDAGRTEPGGECAVDADCDDGVACTTDRCEGARCQSMADHALCDDGALCSAADGCVPGHLCAEASECDDGVFCNGPEACVAGRCAPGSAVDCADAIDCTLDVCDEGRDACEHLALDARCDDGMWCNGTETCGAMGCEGGAAPDCSDAIACTDDACDEASDACVAPVTSGSCLIEEACYAVGDDDGGDFCRTCTAGASDAWTVSCTGAAVDDSQADFAAGDLGRSRATMYAAADGSLRTIQRSDVDLDGYPDLVQPQYYSNTSHSLNSFVLQGGPDGIDDPARRIDIPTVGASSADVADYNQDGYPDIAFCQHYSGSTYDYDSWVYFGSAEGFSTADRVGLPTHGCYDVASADLNRDGWLDLVFGSYRSQSSYSTESYVYLGSEAGFSRTNRIVLPTVGVIGTCLGDLNHDGHVDVVFSGYYNGSNYNHSSYIFWGTADGPDPSSPDRSLTSLGGRGCSLADMDGDGHLEVIQTNHYNGSSGLVNSVIFAGTSTGPDATASTSFGSSWGSFTRVADVDGNGYLDLVVPNYQNGSSYATSSRILYRNATGFSRTEFHSTSGALGAVILDFDGDGFSDVYFSAHYDGDYITESRLFPGTATGASTTASQTYPVTGALGTTRELGNTFDRGWVERFESRVFDLGAPAELTWLSFDATVPTGTALRIQVRSAATAEELDAAPWSGPTSAADHYDTSPVRLRAIHAGHQFAQYRVEIEAPRAITAPIVDAVRLHYR